MITHANHCVLDADLDYGIGIEQLFCIRDIVFFVCNLSYLSLENFHLPIARSTFSISMTGFDAVKLCFLFHLVRRFDFRGIAICVFTTSKGMMGCY